MKTVIFDLDGTLADGRHRLHLLPTKDYDKTESWTEFNLASIWDSPFPDNIELCNLFAFGDYYNVVILTGRSDVARSITEDWLTPTVYATTSWLCVSNPTTVRTR